MRKDGLFSKYEDTHLFTFSGTPQTSTNSSFQHNFNSNLKTLYNESRNALQDMNISNMINFQNHENEQWRYSTNPRTQQSLKKEKMRKSGDSCGKSTIKQQIKHNSNSIKVDLASSLHAQDGKNHLFRSTLSSSKQQKDCSVKEQNIKVYIRLKPKTQRQATGKDNMQIINSQTIKIEDNYFCFDQVFEQTAGQEAIFNQIGLQMCQRLFQGYNGTIFAYGQTGSGKTYTIFGEEVQQHHGLIYRCIRQILNEKDSSTECLKVKCSMVQLYKEQLIDMFGSRTTQLKLKEDKSGGVYIEGLKEVYITNEEAMINLVRHAAKNRKVTSTKLNEESSRSHTILSIYLESSKYTTKLCLIDLAGSQNVCKSGTRGAAFEQTKKINYSLSCLGNVINALTTRKKSDHIPFRDSKLTRILKDSLTGNFLTSIIVNCSTAQSFLHETISSLKFAQRAKKIKVNVQSLEEESIEQQSIQQLHSIIKKLQFDLIATNNQLNKYKQGNKNHNIGVPPRQNSPKKLTVQISPTTRIEQTSFKRKKNQPEEINISQSQISSRIPIPSERAHVDENIRKYKIEKAVAKPHQLMNGLNIDFESLNVSKSIKRQDNSPDISSLSFKYDESPDLSLSFSIQMDSAHNPLFNSPL